MASYPVLRLSVLWLGVAGLAVLRGGIGGGGGVAGEGVELRGVWAKLREGWVEVRLEVRGQTEDMVVTVVLRLVTACDIWLDIFQKERKKEQMVACLLPERCSNPFGKDAATAVMRSAMRTMWGL